MEVEVIQSSKDELEVELESLTIAEILRVYLNKDPNVIFAAWRRAHPTEKPKLKVKTKGKAVNKAMEDAVKAISKDLDTFESESKK